MTDRSSDNGRSESRVRENLLASEESVEVDFGFVAREAGDVPMDRGQREVHQRLWNERGGLLYSDLVLALTNREYPPGKRKSSGKR